MRILVVASYLFDNDLPEFRKNKTGFGIMLNNIVTSLALIADVKLTTHVITKGHLPLIPRHDWKDVLFSARLSDWLDGIKKATTINSSFSKKLKIIYYFVNKGYYRKLIDSFRPDIVNIHGIGISTEGILDVCRENMIPYVVTLHGAIMIDKKASEYDKGLEKKLIIDADKNRTPITVVSTGVKRRLEKEFLKHSCDSIYVIPNGTSISKNIDNRKQKILWQDTSIDEYKTMYEKALKENSYLDLNDIVDYIKKLKLKGTKILGCVGVISEHKNQLLLLEAINGLEQQDIAVLLVGKENDDGAVRKAILKNNLQEKVFMTGFCINMDMIWELIDINVFISKNDGFGLSIIEGYSRGIPSIVAKTLDAFQDIYSIDSCIPINLDVFEIKQGILKALENDWDHQKIKEFSQNYSLEKMALRYYEVFHSTLKRR